MKPSVTKGHLRVTRRSGQDPPGCRAPQPSLPRALLPTERGYDPTAQERNGGHLLRQLGWGGEGDKGTLPFPALCSATSLWGLEIGRSGRTHTGDRAEAHIGAGACAGAWLLSAGQRTAVPEAPEA